MGRLLDARGLTPAPTKVTHTRREAERGGDALRFASRPTTFAPTYRGRARRAGAAGDFFGAEGTGDLWMKS
jgi:hypothetical protein